MNLAFAKKKNSIDHKASWLLQRQSAWFATCVSFKLENGVHKRKVIVIAVCYLHIMKFLHRKDHSRKYNTIYITGCCVGVVGACCFYYQCDY